MFCIYVSGRSASGDWTIWCDDRRFECIPRLSDRIYYHRGACGGPGVFLDCPTRSVKLSVLGAYGRRLDADGSFTSSVTDLLSRDIDCGICPGYEFIGIPYSGWGWKSPFVVDVFGTHMLLLVSYDGKLGATYFSNVCVNFLIVSSNPPIYYFTWLCCSPTYCLIAWMSSDLPTLGILSKVGDMRSRSPHTW
jgi:hypothetical protein